MTPPYGPGGRSHRPKITVLAEAQNWRCCYCHVPMEPPWGRKGDPGPSAATIDHYVARGAGGKAEWHNEVAACVACNSAKGSYSPILFWLLMQAHQCDRRAVHRTLRSLGKKPRANLKCRLNLIHASQGTEGLRSWATCKPAAPVPILQRCT